MNDVVSTIVQIVTCLAVAFAAWQLLFHGRQMHRDFEMLYVQRYWELADRRSEGWALEQAPNKTDTVIVRAYLQLCEDEIDLRKLGRVTDSTWGFWERAICDQVAAEPYRTELAGSAVDAYPMLKHLTRAAVDGEVNWNRDPLERKWLWRKVHGL